MVPADGKFTPTIAKGDHETKSIMLKVGLEYDFIQSDTPVPSISSDTGVKFAEQVRHRWVVEGHQRHRGHDRVPRADVVRFVGQGSPGRAWIVVSQH